MQLLKNRAIYVDIKNLYIAKWKKKRSSHITSIIPFENKIVLKDYLSKYLLVFILFLVYTEFKFPTSPTHKRQRGENTLLSHLFLTNFNNTSTSEHSKNRDFLKGPSNFNRLFLGVGKNP